jgi:murein L,D-transpeptidase YcbB/YkuD
LTNKREQIDPNSIDWRKVNEYNFNYFIRQKGGTSNALGLVKFIFPNKHAIYLHDTPTKYYFDFETRAYSHGCIRVQKALELAEHILKEDDNTYNLDSIHYYIKRQKEKPMALNNKLPIYIYYNSVTSDSLGNLTFYDDVYGLDKKLIYQLTIERDNRISSIR